MRKGISVIEVKIFLILGIITLVGFSFLVKYLKENPWIIYFGILIIIVLIVFAYFQAQEEKKCKKCLSKNTSLVDSNDSVIGWKYMTKKGYPDKRRKNNKAIHLVRKRYKCNDCEHSFEVESTYER
ncbi:MAG: hypothetical protein KGZ62_03410 [Sulfurimonas sp.]|nr:hypothetical protein [Sulfurimonas sp.]